MGDNEKPTSHSGGGFSADLERSLAAERAARSLAEHAEEWIERLRSAAAEAVTTVSLDEVIGNALREVARSLGVDAAAILLASDDGSELVARASVGLIQEVEIGVHIPAGEGFAGRILGTGEPLIVQDAEHYPIYSPTLRKSHLKSIVGVPMIARGQVLGVMHAGSREASRFGEQDLALLEALAYPIAAAVDRVKLFESERALRKIAEITASRLAALQRITSALASARNVADVCGTVVEHATIGTADGAGYPGIWMLRDGRLLRVAGARDNEAYQEIPIDESMPAASHLAGEGPLFVETREELLERWPVLSSAATRAFAGFPLVIGGKRLGVMAVGYNEDHHFDEHERAYLTAVAEQASVALERAQAAELDAAVQERRAFLAETSLALTNRYASPEQLLETLVRLAVPRLADRCTVLLERSGRFERVSLAQHLSLTDEQKAVAEAPLVQQSLGIVNEAFYSGRPVVVGGEGEPPIEAGRFGPLGDLLGITSIMIVPLENHGRPVGVMVFSACGAHAAYRSDDIELAEELAARAGRLVEDLTQRQRERSLAEALTRALLPAHLPTVAGIQLAARYVPAEAGPVGGDWYDAFELPGGLLGLVVGDVGGHGVEAASAMARLRNGLFAFASEGHDPAGTFERLSGLLANDSTDWNIPDPIASIFFAALDRSTLELHATCAGHPPWFLLRAGQAELHECGGRVLAGSLPASPLESHHQLRAGDVCVFITDGLVERPDEEMADSLARLMEAAETYAELELEDFADHLLAATTPPGGRRDDCCLLAIRLAG